MRTEREMMDVILGVAEADERVRAVYMNGSRANPDAPKDKYRDYDVVYMVTETEPYVRDRAWLRPFGRSLIVQEPDLNGLHAGISGASFEPDIHYAYLMLFDDGNRIDLGIETVAHALAGFRDDKLTVVLLDKDGVLPLLSPPTDEDYRVKHPREAAFHAASNNFWWCLNNVAKGIARDELTYTMGMYNGPVRDMLNQMLEWLIGAENDFGVSTGKMGKNFKRYLAPEIYERLRATYAPADYAALWASVFYMCALFGDAARSVADRLGFAYHREEEINMMAYLHAVQSESRHGQS
jgi:aminoglycoside 6-adenylyltransferase